MKRNKLLSVVFLLISASMGAQTFFSTRLEGRVYSKGGDVAATHVLNTTTQSATITDSNGFFSISAKRNDTIVFSAVQFKRKQIVVTASILESKTVSIPLEDILTELDEVVVMPYSLTGDMTRDLGRLETDPVVTASTLGLPNAHVKVISKAERELYAATANPFMSLDPLINAITGRTKMLKKRVARNEKYGRTQRVRAFYADSVYQNDLRIPKLKIDDFMYFCEVDAAFQTVVDSDDRLRLWEFLRKKSIRYRENNHLKTP